MKPEDKNKLNQKEHLETFKMFREARRQALFHSQTGKFVEKLLPVLPDDPFAKMLLDELSEEEYARRSVTADFNRRWVNEGNVVLGKDLFDKNLTHLMFKSNLTSHALLVGPTGIGKSVLLRNLLPQLADENYVVQIFEGAKNEIHDISPQFIQKGFPLYITHLEDHLFNLIQPVIVPRKCIGPYGKAMSLALSANDPTSRFFSEMLEETYNQFQILDGLSQDSTIPTLIDFLSLCLKDRFSNQLVREAAVSRLSQVARELKGARFRSGLTPEELSGKNLIFRCRNVSQESRDIFIGLYITMLSLLRSQDQAKNHTTLLIVIEDGQNFIRNPESILAEKSNYIRSQNMGFLLSVQNSEIAPMFLSNVGTIFMGRSNSSEDIDRIGRNIGYLSLEQRTWLSENLSVGQFLVSLRNNDWNYPFLIQTRPFIPQNQTIPPDCFLTTTEDFERAFQTQLVEAEEQQNFRPRQVLKNPSGNKAHSGEAINDSQEKSLHEKDFIYLEIVLNYPEKHFGFYVQYFKDHQVRISPAVAKEIREKLARLNLIELEKIQTHSTGRESLIHYPTRKGVELLKQFHESKTTK